MLRLNKWTTDGGIAIRQQPEGWTVFDMTSAAACAKQELTSPEDVFAFAIENFTVNGLADDLKIVFSSTKI